MVGAPSKSRLGDQVRRRIEASKAEAVLSQGKSNWKLSELQEPVAMLCGSKCRSLMIARMGCANRMQSLERLLKSLLCPRSQVRTQASIKPATHLILRRSRLREAPYRAVYQRAWDRTQLWRSPYYRRPSPHPLITYCSTAPSNPHIHPRPACDIPERMGRAGFRNIQLEGAISTYARGTHYCALPA